MRERKKNSKRSKKSGHDQTENNQSKYDWNIRVFKQVLVPPFLQFCAIAERCEPGKKWIVNAEGKTPDEAVANLKNRLRTSEFDK